MAAGKAVAEKTRQAREVQKKVLAEANVIIANHKAKKAAKREPPVEEPKFKFLTVPTWPAATKRPNP